MSQHTPNAINGPICPSCGRDNSDYKNICTAEDCPGVQAQQHTPTPWTAKQSPDGVWTVYPTMSPIPWVAGLYSAAPDSHGRNIESEANAAFIVRACNSHDALVDALAGLLGHHAPGLEADDLEGQERHAQARAALAIAKEA